MRLNVGRLSVGDLLSLGPSTDLETAGQALGVGRTKSYELAQRGEFPVRVLRIGRAYRVPTADLLKLLGVEQQKSA